MKSVILTPTFWLTVAGVVLLALGWHLASGICLVTCGWGGIGISLQLGVVKDKDPWRVDTVLEVIYRVLRGELPWSRWGLIGHLPQAIAGIVLLVVG